MRRTRTVPIRLFAPAAMLLAAVATLNSCGSSSPEPVIAEAFVGAVSTPIKDGLTTKAKVIAEVQHGELVKIVSTRRRFFRVRAKGVEGWIDGFQLMTGQEIAELKQLADSTKELTSQGAASTYDALNVHTEASRHSPSFYRLPEKAHVDVIGHTTAVRIQGPPPEPPVMEAVRQALEPPVTVRKKKPSSRIPPPPRPAGPRLPDNWQDLSKTVFEQPAPGSDPGETNKRSVEQVRKALMEGSKKIALTEDWTLVRLKDGRAGWVLTSMLLMSIPDDVAQYAEGSRITSYFPLMQVTTPEGETRNFWLWTTRKREPDNYQFDSFRVFTWSLKRARYETAYRENNVRGYYPVSVTKGTPTTFTLIVEEPGPVFLRKTYEFDGRLVRLKSQTETPAPSRVESKKLPMSVALSKQGRPVQPAGFVDRVKQRLKSVFN